ncbi:MAG: glutamine amidotransferase subunit PdxT [Deltaproteobacteria bacterium]|nr:glutamine amidotransferase subunit PdxT [Deltaproteobacteria bacterium]
MRHVGVLALQGAVSEHMDMLGRVGAKASLVRHPEDLASLDGLVIPGGESTAISRLIRQNGLFEAIRTFAENRRVLGTCAGLVLCGTEVSGTGGALPGRRGGKAAGKVMEELPEEATEEAGNARLEPLGLLDMAVSRNGFGRQVDSFETTLAVGALGGDIPAVFIRAPYIERIGKGVTALASLDGKIVMAESRTVLVTAFHPELAGDLRVARYFCGAPT